MELLILRHGKSSWKDLSLDDFDRPLKGRGRRDAEAMGQYIQDRCLLPDLVLCSTAKRAVQTLKRAMKNMDIPSSCVKWSPNLYHAETETWMKQLSAVPASFKRVMVVGHNPGLEDLVIFLSKKPISIPEDGKLIPTATLALFEIETEWKHIGRGAGRLTDIIRPRTLSMRY